MKDWKVPGILILLAILALEVGWLAGHPRETAAQPSPDAPMPDIASPSPTAEPTPTPEPVPVPEHDWQIAIASAAHPLEGEYEIETVAVGNGYLFDARAADALNAMLDAAQKDGMGLYICSAWRSRATQEQLYENRVYRFQLEGYGREEAEEKAAAVVARPGTSEHELGLTIDFLTSGYSVLDSGFAEQPEYAWLREHCAEYGFIERYPNGKGDITGIIWEPWHYRYVGVEVAEYIMSNGLCLEEYLELLA